MKKLFYIPVLFLFIVSCSKGIDEPGGDSLLPPSPNPDTDPDPDSSELVEVSLKPVATANIFELIDFQVLVDGKEMLLEGLFTLREYYDSLLWIVSDRPEHFRFFNYTPNAGNFVPQWGHNFFFPGEYETYIHGYKSGQIIHRDTLPVTVVDRKDFLGFNWSEITGPARYTGYMDVISEEYQFRTYPNVHDQVPYVEFYLHRRRSEESYEDQKFLLREYLNRLYPGAEHLTASASVQEKYDELFYFQSPDAIPTDIWITDTSVIVLQDFAPFLLRSPRIYAEPRW